MSSNKKTVLLFNPWIYDFAAYDFWTKPLGLLSIGAVLRKLGYHIELCDCLDRYHPALNDLAGYKQREKADGSGKFFRSVLPKPSVVQHVPRRFCRYGMPPEIVRALLLEMEPPDVVLVTSYMTYWYPAVVDAVQLIRQVFPGIPIVLGGIYTTLCPQHAQTHVKPDYLITGEGEMAAVQLVSDLTGGPGRTFSYSHLDELPWPALDLYPNLRSIAMLTSRGCPFSCSFCASRQLVPHYRRRQPDNVLRELRFWHENRGVKQVAFFDDALLSRANEFIKPVLKAVIDQGLEMNFHTPNGLTPRYIDDQMADLFAGAGVKTVRLSFETSNAKRQQAMSAKVTNRELADAINRLHRAGYSSEQIGVYVMMGLPNQRVEEVEESISYVQGLGAKVHLASFSPIPGTAEWQAAIDAKLWEEENDLLLTNTTLFPLWSKTIGYEAAFNLSRKAKASGADGANKEAAVSASSNVPVE